MTKNSTTTRSKRLTPKEIRAIENRVYEVCGNVFEYRIDLSSISSVNYLREQVSNNGYGEDTRAFIHAIILEMAKGTHNALKTARYCIMTLAEAMTYQEDIDKTLLDFENYCTPTFVDTVTGAIVFSDEQARCAPENMTLARSLREFVSVIHKQENEIKRLEALLEEYRKLS